MNKEVEWYELIPSDALYWLGFILFLIWPIS